MGRAGRDEGAVVLLATLEQLKRAAQGAGAQSREVGRVGGVDGSQETAYSETCPTGESGKKGKVQW